MKAAPGAQLSIQDIFGRDDFIAGLWRVLDTNSIRMEAERRIGKTSILHKMAAQPAPGWEPVSLDLEPLSKMAEVARIVRHGIDGYYPKEQKVVLALLDHAVKATGSLGQIEFINVAKSAGAADDDRVRELLRLLAVDHYLSRDIDGRYTFRNALLRQWWIIERGLQ